VNVEQFIGLVILGLVAGVIGTLIGAGGGFIVIPFLLLMAHVWPASFSASAQEADFNPANNIAQLATIVEESPTIVTQPASLIITQGQSAVFSVVAAGAPPLRYFWLFNGSALAGQTNPVLALTNVPGSADGTYQVVVSNRVGQVLSEPAILTVLVPVSITEQPQGSTNQRLICAGRSAW
jgi:hypothetical protein